MASLQPSDKVSGNVGVRFVNTKMNITAFLPGGKPNYESSYDDVLPSLNLRADLSKDGGTLRQPRHVASRFRHAGLQRPARHAAQWRGQQPLPQAHAQRQRRRQLRVVLRAQVRGHPGSVLQQPRWRRGLRPPDLPYADNSKGGVIANHDISSPVNTSGTLSAWTCPCRRAWAVVLA